MHKSSSRAGALASLLVVAVANAADTDINVIISGEVRPGVYGRVDFGNFPAPPVLYAKPVIILREPRPVAVTPIYLHVPPGHAKNWRKHCHKYRACGQPVYFVVSDEYKKPRKEKKDKKDK